MFNSTISYDQDYSYIDLIENEEGYNETETNTDKEEDLNADTVNTNKTKAEQLRMPYEDILIQELEHTQENETISLEESPELTDIIDNIETTTDFVIVSTSAQDMAEVTTTMAEESTNTALPEPIPTPLEQFGCDCECDSNLRYLVPGARSIPDEELQIVLQQSALCSEKQQDACCTQFSFVPIPSGRAEDPRARFKFPCHQGWSGPDCSTRVTEGQQALTDDEEDTTGNSIEILNESVSQSTESNSSLVELDVSETILVDTEGIPQICKPYMDKWSSVATPQPAPAPTSLPNVLDRSVVTVADLATESNLNNSIESLGSWLIIVPLSSPSQLSLRMSSRTAIPCLARRGGHPSLGHFEILATVDGKTREAVTWQLGAGDWHIRLHNEESFDQEVLVSLELADSSSRVPCCRAGCRLMEGRSMCPGDPGLQCQNGEEQGGRCQCEKGWLGPSCSVTREECREDVCHGRGDCMGNEDKLGQPTTTCACDAGSTGDGCTEDECNCGEQGVCTSTGTCRFDHSYIRRS